MQQCGSASKTHAEGREPGIILYDSVVTRQTEPTCAEMKGRWRRWRDHLGKDTVHVGTVFCILRGLWVTRRHKFVKA